VADVLTARALASLDRLLAYANDLLNPGGVAIFPKGAGAERELTDARNRWHYDYARVESVTDDRAAIFCFTEIRCAGRG
jgi:Predicted S-adenosylmethionine-dependent methyltransferase involved in bacterial cell division